MQKLFSASMGGLLLTTVLTAQPSTPSDPQPIYRVTVVSRSLEAVNYQHHGGPTPIDFRGTVLLPDAKGSAIIDSRRGSTSIEAKLEHMWAPTRFGREYLTYVLWAISPEGRPRNLGEILVDSSNKAHLKVTTELQAFGLMITAEPYYSVTTPGDVVVAENVVLPETIGTREEVMAKYELLPRGQYTLNVRPAQFRSFDREQEKLPYDRYEAVLELYQAENAVQIARSLDADRFASESFSKAATLLSQAQDMTARKMDPQAIVSAAREATQMAEDARTIAVRRKDVDRREREAERLREQGELRRRAEEDAHQARADADREDAERVAAERARADAEIVPPPHVMLNREAAQQQDRAQLLAQLNNAIATRDTPRGLIVTVNDTMFEPGNDRLRGTVSGRLANVAAILSSHPGVRVRVEGYADSEALSDERARSVRATLVANGASADLVSAIGYGNSRPITEQKTAAGHEQNRRVEIVIYGDSIGNKALWDHPYPLSSQR